MRAILTYHSIDDSGSPVSVGEAALRRQVRWLASGAVRVVGLEEIGALPADANAVALTFDDGFLSFGEKAWPLLKDHGLPVTVFVVTRCAGATNAWGGRPSAGIPTLPLLGWDAIGRLADEGVTLGAHGRSHADLRTLASRALEDEVAGCAEDLAARTGRRPVAFAYAYGEVSDAAAACAARAYAVACTTDHRPLRRHEDPHLLPRLDAYYYRGGGLEAWGSPLFHARTRARRALRDVRRLAARVPGG